MLCGSSHPIRPRWNRFNSSPALEKGQPDLKGSDANVAKNAAASSNPAMASNLLHVAKTPPTSSKRNLRPKLDHEVGDHSVEMKLMKELGSGQILGPNVQSWSHLVTIQVSWSCTMKFEAVTGASAVQMCLPVSLQNWSLIVLLGCNFNSALWQTNCL